MGSLADVLEEKAMAKGLNIMNTLVAILLDEGRSEDLQRATKDTDYRDKLFEEYGIV